MLNPERQQHNIPTAALVLGVAGLIPFVALAAVAVFRLEPALGLTPAAAIWWLTLYAAIILSFMGGVQWGLAVQTKLAVHRNEWRTFGVSVVPALVAWGSLGLTPRTCLVTLACGFVALLAYDVWTVRQNEAPPWYARLRLGLTSIVVVTLCLAAALM